MKFGYTIIYVNDVEATLAFYQQAFGLEIGFFHESKQYGELKTGNTTLAFASEALSESNGVTFVKNNKENLAAGFEVALITENVDDAYKNACAAGAIAVKDPVEKPWGQRVAYVRDLNGILIEIASPM